MAVAIMNKIIPTFICAVLLLQGCAGAPSQQSKKPNVTSNPSGATVYANSLEIGLTPLQKNLFNEFPAGWKGGVYSARGVLVIKKTGCKDYTLKINDRILSEPIHADLECSEVSAITQSAPDTTMPQVDPEARLIKLESLYKKQLITEKEYKQTRERILNEL